MSGPPLIFLGGQLVMTNSLAGQLVPQIVRYRMDLENFFKKF